MQIFLRLFLQLILKDRFLASNNNTIMAKKLPYSIKWIAESFGYNYSRLWRAATGYSNASEMDKEILTKGKKQIAEMLLEEVEQESAPIQYTNCTKCQARHSQPRNSPLCLACKIKEREGKGE